MAAHPRAEARTHVRTRDYGLLRLRRLTIALGAGATALTGVFAGIGAASFHGRHLTHAAPPARRAAKRARPREVPAPTPRLPASSSAEVPAPPSAAPTQSAAPPVVVSGGS